jgi:alkyl sulfatase BDS1-like metallo-beta-lactamase superfamily hydrolase
MRINGPKAAGTSLLLNLVFSDTGEKAVLELRNGSLSHSLDRTADDADATVSLGRESLNKVIVGESDLLSETKSGEITVEPDQKPLETLIGFLDEFSLGFNIVEP